MNNLYQDNWFDYTQANKDFYKKATSEPLSVDWAFMLTMLRRYSRVPYTEISRHIEGEHISFMNRTMETTELRDHVEGVSIGKINQPNEKIMPSEKTVREALTRLVCKYVEPNALRFV